MITAIISDVHGNYPALEAVLNEIDRIGCDQIISLGDVVGYYCMINECISVFRKRNIINLMGNHDSYLLGLRQCQRSYTVNKCIEYQKSIITRENYDYLSNSPVTLDTDSLSARHGGWTDPIDEYISTFDFSSFRGEKRKFFCSGHTHIQILQKNEDLAYVNPGSVGQPRDNNSLAAFSIIDDNDIQIYRVKYDIDLIARKMKEAGFEERIYSCLYTGTRIQSFKG